MKLNIPEIVRLHVVETLGRMPQTQEEVDKYLDLINHAKEYAHSKEIEMVIGEKFMKQLGMKTPSEIKKEGKIKFQ